MVAYPRGGLAANPALVGLGALATAYTVTLFYMLMLDIWRLRFGKRLGWFGALLLGAGVLRLIIMLFPANQWGQVVPPYGPSLVRNALLTVQGVGVLFLILRDATRAGDRAFQWIGGMIALSFLFYIPVILWVAQVPMLGMLMMPKTLAYVAIAVIAYRALWPAPESRRDIQGAVCSASVSALRSHERLLRTALPPHHRQPGASIPLAAQIRTPPRKSWGRRTDMGLRGRNPCPR